MLSGFFFFEKFCVFLSRFGGTLCFLFCSGNHFLPFAVLKNFVFSNLSLEKVAEKCDVKIRKCTNRSSNTVYLSTDIDPTRTTLLSTKIDYFICYLINRNFDD